MDQHSRRHVIGSMGAIGLGAILPARAQQTRPVRLLVGFPPGTAPDTVARIVTQKMGENMQQPFVVENVAGAGGLIAAQQASKAAPDGTTLFMNTVSDMSIAPHIYNKLPYNPNDFALISHLVYTDFILAIPPSVPAQSLREYVTWAKSRKDTFMATFGPGSPAHFGTAMFAGAAGLKIEPVHYKTTADAMSGVLSGEVPGLFVTASLGVQYVKDGKLRALAVTSPTRMPQLPDVPSFAEVGMPQAVFSAWFGLAAPQGTPTPILERVSSEARKALQSPDVRQKLEAAGFRISGTNREEFAKIVQKEYAAWGTAARSTGFRAD
ncbi:Bug family tripartite tricarboxylate transporter substrate binding protein [Acidovorax sp. Leaf84]|uniref:Bug family tripartite tricarboxylate transporter substrate binding protein n=1 Tax=Acidovorax sp. Leaf84 TaxID=1736240 RepID=UPI0009E786C8|nr:tripartite tricarboxylate transporter substrate binding protein [Acidovorax sp. Leaf84]